MVKMMKNVTATRKVGVVRSGSRAQPTLGLRGKLGSNPKEHVARLARCTSTVKDEQQKSATPETSSLNNQTEEVRRSSGETSGGPFWDHSDFTKMGEATVEAFDDFLHRYDFVSTGAGAVLVTSYCVFKGQCVWTGLMIAATATVTALVMNELMESSFYNNE